MAITTIDQVKQANALQAQIDTITELKTIATQAQSEHWLVQRLTATDTAGVERSLIAAPLNDAASQQALVYCIGVYDQMLAGLNGQLSTLLG